MRAHPAGHCNGLPSPLTGVVCDTKCRAFEWELNGNSREVATAENIPELGTRYQSPKASGQTGQWRRFQENLPQWDSNFELETPAELSPDRRWLIAGALSTPNRIPPRDVVLIDATGKAVQWTQRQTGYVASVSWSPDSTLVAVAVVTPLKDPDRGLLDAYAGAFGFKVHRGKGSIHVLDLAGEQVCSVEVFDNLPSTTFYATWSK